MEKGKDFTGVTIVYYCHDGAGNVLLNKRSRNCRDEWERWDCGGGGLEFGDSVESTLRKEIAEEYKTDVLDFEYLGFREIHRNYEKAGRTHWIALDFKVRVDKDKVQNGEPHKFDTVEWFSAQRLPEPLHSQLPIFLNKYKGKL